MTGKDPTHDPTLVRRLLSVYTSFERIKNYRKTGREMYKFVSFERISAAYRTKFGYELTRAQMLKLKNEHNVDIRKMGQHTFIGLSHTLVKTTPL